MVSPATVNGLVCEGAAGDGDGDVIGDGDGDGAPGCCQNGTTNFETLTVHGFESMYSRRVLVERGLSMVSAPSGLENEGPSLLVTSLDSVSFFFPSWMYGFGS